MSSCNLLEVLPLDVLELVLSESRQNDVERYSGLRLVCKTINDIVERRVFAACTIEFTDDTLGIIEDKLSNIASGVGPHSRWAKKLQIRDLVPIVVEGDPQYARLQGEDRERMLLCQSQWLVPAIKALVHVEEAESCVGMSEPCNDVICALSDLPKLRKLSLTFPQILEKDHIPIERFSNLKVVKLKYLYLFPSLLESTAKMIARCPNILELGIDQAFYPDEETSVDLAMLVGDALRSPTFSPTLTRLSVSQDRVILTPACVPFLKSLTHLHIREDATRADRRFWAALRDSGVQLQGLDVSPMYQPVIDYLQSYAGLQELSIGWPYETVGLPQPVDDDKICYQFYYSVLPKHQASLKALSFRQSKLGAWCIAEPHLKQLYLCQGLKHLDLMCYHPSPNEKAIFPIIPLGKLFAMVSENLPNLHRLELKMARKFQQGFGCGYAARGYFQAIYKYFAYAINKTTFSSPEREPQFSVFAVGIWFEAVADPSVPGQYRFMVENAGKHGISVDTEVQDRDARSDQLPRNHH